MRYNTVKELSPPHRALKSDDTPKARRAKAAQLGHVSRSGPPPPSCGLPPLFCVLPSSHEHGGSRFSFEIFFLLSSPPASSLCAGEKELLQLFKKIIKLLVGFTTKVLQPSIFAMSASGDADTGPQAKESKDVKEKEEWNVEICCRRLRDR
ncbi:hypothetical protein SRHO_G00215140 [Serrasalmus rhombeus]